MVTQRSASDGHKLLAFAVGPLLVLPFVIIAATSVAEYPRNEGYGFLMVLIQNVTMAPLWSTLYIGAYFLFRKRSLPWIYLLGQAANILIFVGMLVVVTQRGQEPSFADRFLDTKFGDYLSFFLVLLKPLLPVIIFGLLVWYVIRKGKAYERDLPAPDQEMTRKAALDQEPESNDQT
tara:strand:- start:1046 stop:1576 length:531 start_codon:yes stop_codon:yes gene_type:complete